MGQLACRLGYEGVSALRADRLSTVVAQCARVTILTISAKGEVTGALDESRDVLGVPDFLLLGQGFLDRVHLTDRVAFLNMLDMVHMHGGEQHLPLRLRLPQRNTEMSATFGRFETGVSCRAPGEAILLTLRVADDRPDLLRRIAELETDQARLEVAKSRFMASTSHELRTPLNAIIGFSDLMLLDVGGVIVNEKQREYVGLIKASGQHLLSVVNTIIDMSRIETGNYALEAEELDVEAVVEMALAMVRNNAAESGITLSTRIDDDCARINGDRRAIQQILINLLSNAVKFTPQGGSVSVAVDRFANWMRFTVDDSGIGMDHAFVEQIGTPFLQADNDYTRRFEGTGLGLSIVKGLVELHGGKLEIVSEPGKGTRVCVLLPALAGQMAKAVARINALAKWSEVDEVRKIA
jgi:cell cycle sensor histidine kinase DivJ